MIKKTVKIGDKEVEFACSAGTITRYRAEFNEDIFSNLAKMTMENPDLDVLNKMAFIMAKQADPSIEDYEKWLDQFELLDFMSALPEISALWTKNTLSASTSKKK